MFEMKSYAVPAPGIVYGGYPQRGFAERSRAEAFLRRLVAVVSGARWTRRPLASSAFVEGLRRSEANCQALTDEQFAEKLKTSRMALAKCGFQDEWVAQVLALIQVAVADTLGMRCDDSQFIGSWTILNGKIAEMEPSTGKTLAVALAAATAALAGVPVHVFTGSDYLVRRDVTWLRPLYQRLGLTVAVVTEDMDALQRRRAYECDVVYCTARQLVFDYLTDRLALGKSPSRLRLYVDLLRGARSQVRRLQLRGLCFGIVDGADHILIDGACTPLVISKPRSAALDQDLIYLQALTLARQLAEGEDYFLDARGNEIRLLESGWARIQELSSGYRGFWRGHRRSKALVRQGLYALHLCVKDKHYVVRDGTIRLIDEATRQLAADRSRGQGLVQLLEAKEECEITRPKETLARISYQQFFGRYLKLGGSASTANDVAGELRAVYGLGVHKVACPWSDRRVAYPVRIFRSAGEQRSAMVERIVQLHRQGRPVLVGTRTPAAADALSELLQAAGLSHRVLYSMQDALEAEVHTNGGEKGGVFLGANIAWRDIDIKLGDGVDSLGGLHAIAAEVFESRRMEQQLFGCCGRLGKPGSYETMLSLEDGLVLPHLSGALFRPVLRILEVLEQPKFERLAWLLVRACQKKVESEHARLRRNMLRLDEQRNSLLAFAGFQE